MLQGILVQDRPQNDKFKNTSEAWSAEQPNNRKFTFRYIFGEQTDNIDCKKGQILPNTYVQSYQIKEKDKIELKRNI